MAATSSVEFQHGQRSWARKLFRLLAGVGLVVLGIIGLILPVMPGWVFLIPGLILLSEFCPRLRRVVVWARERAFRLERVKPDSDHSVKR